MTKRSEYGWNECQSLQTSDSDTYAVLQLCNAIEERDQDENEEKGDLNLK